MNRNPYNRFLRAPVADPSETVGNPAEAPFKSLSDRLAEANFGAEKAPENPYSTPTPKQVAPSGPRALDTNPPEGESEPDEEENDEEGDEEDLPTIGKAPEPAKKDDEPLSEERYDLSTDEIAALLEKSGHPGDLYKTLRASIKAQKQKIQALKAETKTRTVDPSITAELETLRTKAAEADALRKRNEELLLVNDQVAVRESPEYKDKVLASYDAIEDVVKIIAEANSLDAKTLASIVLEADPIKQDKAIDALSAKVGIRSATRLANICDDYKKTQALEKAMLEKPDKTLSASKIRQDEERKKEKDLTYGAYKAATADVFKERAKLVPGFVDSAGQLTPLGESVRDANASIDPSTLSPGDIAVMAFAANSFNDLRRAYTQLKKENASLKAGRPAGLGTQGTKVPVAANGEPLSLIEKMRGMNFTLNGR